MTICEQSSCTGCGMCVNICHMHAIQMEKSTHGFDYPVIDARLCENCGLCKRLCPANSVKATDCNVQTVYAAWDKNRKDRKNASSGGVYSLLAKSVLDENGVVAGVRWNAAFSAVHFIASSYEQIKLMRGSKYVQSHTGSIYADVEKVLQSGKRVLFSGTPCQNHALKLYLRREYANLFQVDLICHGVPSDDMLQRYLVERIGGKDRSVTNIRFRHKRPYWDYSNVTIDYSDGSQDTMPNIADPYFALFGIGYSLRESCSSCPYANTHRYGDITLADFWGYFPISFEMRDYNAGISCVMINTRNGRDLFERIKKELVCAESSLNVAIAGNQSLSSPWSLPQKDVEAFWRDYEAEMSVADLYDKFVPNKRKKPARLWLDRLRNRYRWMKHI